MKIIPTTIVKTATNIPQTQSIRRMFYNGPSTLDDMSKERVQATVFDTVRFIARKYKTMWFPFRLLFGVHKRPDAIEKSIIPNVKQEFAKMEKREFSKLQKALVIIENPKGKKKRLYQDSVDFYLSVVDRIVNKTVFHN